MKVWNRINARKIVLSYFYQRCFFHNLSKQNVAISQALWAENIFPNQVELFEKAKQDLFKIIQEQLDLSDKENLEYFIKTFFDRRAEKDIDLDYIFKVWESFEKCIKQTIKKVDKYTESFSFSEMNTMNQAIFVLWYTERKVLETPKEILLNELIELSKRYDDEWSPKLINWIMHKVFNNI